LDDRIWRSAARESQKTMSRSQLPDSPASETTLDAFMSYSHDDADSVIPIVEAARARGRRLWIDGDDIPPGAPWRAELGTALEAATAVVTCLSPGWLESEECRREYERAVELGKRLVPVVIAPIATAPDRLSALQWINASDGSDPEEVAEALLSAVDTDHDRAREHTEWLSRAVHWDGRGRDRSSLLRGRDLQSAEDWLARAGVDPSPAPMQVALITASRRAERRRLRTTIAISFFTILLTTALMVVALIQRTEAIKQRNQAQSRALAAAAQSQLDIDPERSLLLASTAYATAPTSQSVAALRTALQQSRVGVTVAAHQAPVSGALWTADVGTVLTSARDGSLAAWDAASGRPRGRLDLGPGAIERLVAARTAPIGVAMTEGGAAVLWQLDPATGELAQRARLVSSGAVDVAISDDGQTIVTAMGENGVGVWTADGKPGSAVSWDSRGARSVALSADGSTLLVGTDAQTVVGAMNGDRPVVLGRGPSPRVQLSADGRVALLVPDDRPAAVRRTADGATLIKLPLAFQAALDPSGRRAVVARVDGRVDMLSVEDAPVSLLGRGTPATAVGFSADGNEVVAAQLDGNIQVWQSSGGTSLGKFRGSSASSLRVGFSADGQQLVSGHGDGAVRIWALPQRPTRLALTAGSTYRFQATGVSFSPDGHTVLTAARDGRARTWDAHTGQEKPSGDRCEEVPVGPHCLARATVLAQFGRLTRAVYSPNGQFIATSSQFGITVIWDSATAKQVARAPDIGAAVDDLAFARDSAHLATADRQGKVRIIETRTGQVRSELGQGGPVYAVAYLPRGDTVLAAGEDGLVRAWAVNPASRAPRALAKLDDNAVFDLAVDRQGRQAAAATDTGILLLDPADGHRLRNLVGHRGFVIGWHSHLTAGCCSAAA
jgi:WD40 repeat protein